MFPRSHNLIPGRMPAMKREQPTQTIE
jgi:hypothetical protein